MPDIVDCRRCRFFVSKKDMDDAFLEAVLGYARRHGVREPVLGWCEKRQAPVTYYRGRCRFYEPRPPVEHARITDYAG